MTDRATTKPPIVPVVADGGSHKHALSAEDILTDMRRQTYLMCASTLTNLEASVGIHAADDYDAARSH